MEPPGFQRATNMAIISTVDNVSTNLFEGRVLKVEVRSETRNWSDTLDYTDYRTTECTYALVWLGTHNFPPTVMANRAGVCRPMIDWRTMSKDLREDLFGQPRDLEYYEQFAWVDCTNLFTHMGQANLQATVDTSFADAMNEPLMWANFIAWEGYMHANYEAAERQAAEAAELHRKVQAENAKKQAERDAKKAARSEASKAVADVAFAALPANGTELTVKGFTGKLFWKKVTQYRGTWGARFGLKNTKGEVVWFTSEDM